MGPIRRVSEQRTAQKAVPVCARCGTESSIGQIRLDNLLKWVCPDYAGIEERQGDGRFGEPGDGTLFTQR
jgi:hypothetical protein